jgi:diguanylate cyclase (GGDEF)-like protein
MKRGTRLTSILLVFICLSLASLTAWQIWFSYERALHDLNVANLNLAQALDNYSEGVIRQSELVLVDLAERLEQEGKGRAHLERLQKVVREQSRVLKLASTIIIYDAKGDRLLVSRGDINARPNAADRAFFIHHRDNPSTEIFIGPTIKSRLAHEWVFTVSRRLNDADGKFSGVVAITLSVEHFLHLFGSLDLGKQGTMSLSSSDGTLLFRQPFREQDVGLDWSDSPIWQTLRQHNQATTARISRIDGIERLYALRRNSNLPLITVVALGRDEALTAWRRDARLFTTVILILLLAVGIIGQRLLVDVRRRSRAERQLLSAREELLDANARLEILASQDALTGLANRRSFDQTLEAEIRRAQRQGSDLTLMLLDIDLFKHYNDHYGHLAGDACLRSVTNLLKRCMRRPGDLAARYGGEELAVILPNTSDEGAQSIALAFMESLKQSDLPHENSPFQRITVSIGLASLQPDTQDSATIAMRLIETADQALYRAKAKGRNRLESAMAQRSADR